MGASTTSIREDGAPSASAGPNRSECTPCSAARAAPAATSAAPKSAPLQSTATTVAGASSAAASDEEGGASGATPVRLLFLGDGHRGGKATSRERSYFSLSSRSLAQRGSAPRSWWCPGGASFR